MLIGLIFFQYTRDDTKRKKLWVRLDGRHDLKQLGYRKAFYPQTYKTRGAKLNRAISKLRATLEGMGVSYNAKTYVVDRGPGATSASIYFVDKKRHMGAFIALHNAVGTKIRVAELVNRPRPFVFFVGRKPAGHCPFPNRSGHIGNIPGVFTIATAWQCLSEQAH